MEKKYQNLIKEKPFLNRNNTFTKSNTIKKIVRYSVQGPLQDKYRKLVVFEKKKTKGFKTPKRSVHSKEDLMTESDSKNKKRRLKKDRKKVVELKSKSDKKAKKRRRTREEKKMNSFEETEGKMTGVGEQDNYINIYVQNGKDLKKRRKKVSSGSSGDMSNLYSVKVKREVGEI